MEIVGRAHLCDEGVVGEGDDPDGAEEDAHYIAENTEFARLWPVLWITPSWSAVDGGGGGGTLPLPLLHPPVVGDCPQETLDVP